MTTRAARPISKACLSISALALGAAPLLGAGPSIERETNRERVALTELEGRPVDTGLFSTLTDHSHPGALDSANTQGKVVVIGLVSMLEPRSIMTMSALERIHRNNASNGVLVVAVHPEAGYDQIMAKVSSGDVTIPVAKDTGGALARALHSDDYPDLFVIDRAGQLRYADIKSKSLKHAVALLSGETPEAAIANAQTEAEGGTLEVASAEGASKKDLPPPAAYRKAAWPQTVPSRYISAKDIQGQKLPYEVGEHEEWIANRRDLSGKVLVVDFWATWCGPCKRAAPTLIELQGKHEGKMEVVGIGGSEDKTAFINYLRNHEYNYAQMFDRRKVLSNAVGVRGIPHVLIVSTDGVVRWQGNPLADNFSEVVDAVVAADPLVSPEG